MRSFFAAFKNDEWCQFVVRIGSPTEAHKGSFEEGLLQPLVIEPISLGKI